MQDELQSEEQSVTTEPISTGNDETPATETAPARTPAATASSYRDIIAERLARTAPTTARGGNDASTHSPMAHSSDIEFTQRPEAASSTSSQEIELRAGRQESANDGASEEASDANLSGRERARLRQQERAALRKQGPRTAEQRRTEEPIENEQSSSEEATEPSVCNVGRNAR